MPQISPDGWIARYRPNPSASSSLLFFLRGRRASIFRQWPAFLPPDIEICAIQLPGRRIPPRGASVYSSGSLAETLADIIAPYLDRPFAFFGHSMGSLVCFEVARQLAEGEAPRASLHGAFRAVHLPKPECQDLSLPLEVFKVILRADGIPERILQMMS